MTASVKIFILTGALCLAAACRADPSATSHAQKMKTPSKNVEKAQKPVIVKPAEGEKILYPDGRSVLLKATKETNGAGQIFVGTEDIPKGTAIPVHAHDGYEEVIFLHKGSALLTLGDQTVKAEPGTTMYIPPGTWHGVANTDQETTRMVFIFPEPDLADFFRSVGAKEGEAFPKLTGDDWQKIMKKHKMRAKND